MVFVDSLRLKPTNKYMECVHINENGDPIAYVSSTPCFGDNVWSMQQHCSTVKGHGISIMMDVMKAVITNPFIDYVIGFYNPKNKKAGQIWKLAYSIMDNTKICDIAHYELIDYIFKPINKVSKLYLDAFKVQNHEIKKTLKLFARPTGKIPPKGKRYDAVLFEVCDESKTKFRQLFN